MKEKKIVVNEFDYKFNCILGVINSTIIMLYLIKEILFEILN